MDDPRVGTVVNGRYEIHERLAAGGMGVVYRGERVGIAKPVAIKFLHRNAALMPDRLARFRRELTAMSRLSHPNLMSIIDFGEADGVPYLVMEYHAGSSLREALKWGALEPRRAVYIAYQILAGLGSAHASGVLHRDLKPGNVLLVGGPGEDLVKILDFGIAKLLDTGAGPTEVSVMAGRVLGTPQYMAPEQARSQAVDPRTDIYAVGIMLYEMVVGRRPFDGENDLAVLRQQVEDSPVPPRAVRPEISAELEAVIVRALAKSPDDRWASAQELANALLDLPEGSSVLRLRAGTTGRGTAEEEEEYDDEPPRRSHGVRNFLLTLLVLAGLGAGGVYAASRYGYLTGMPWQASAAPDAAPDVVPADAAPPDAPPPDAAPPIRAELQPYVDFLRQQRSSPVNYLIGLFDTHDVVALCMRPPSDSSQYLLVTELIRDRRFVEHAGRVISDSDDSETQSNVHAIDVALPPDRQVVIVPPGQQLVNAVRDLDAGSKALVLLNDCQQARSFPDDVARVLLDQLRDDEPLAGGRWDAAFERAGNRPVGFDIAGSPFGADDVGEPPDGGQGATYEQQLTGIVFDRPLSEAELEPNRWAHAQAQIARWLQLAPAAEDVDASADASAEDAAP